MVKSIIFPPVDVKTEMKLRRLLEKIEDYMDVEITVDFTIIHNAFVMKVSFSEARCDIEDLIQAIANCTEKTAGVKVENKG